MPKTTTQITDEESLKKLKESHLEKAHKDVLSPLVPKMNPEEREELLILIDESHEVAKKAEQMKVKYQKELYELNKEYEKKMDTVVKEEATNARKQFEALEKTEEKKELEELETELKKIK